MGLRLTWGSRELATFASASGSRAPSVPEDADTKRRKQPWQDRAFFYYENLGEIWYGGQFYARTLSRLELVVQELKVPEERRSSDNLGDAGDTDEPTDPEWQPTDDENALDALDRVRDAKGGRSHLQAQYGRLRFLNGEGYLCCFKPNGDERWEFLSISEMKPLDGGNRWERNVDGANEKKIYDRMPPGETAQLPNQVIVYRLWSEHPRYTALADSPMRGVLDQCEELVLLDRAVRSRTRSRIASSGMLLIPTQISSPPRTNGTGENARQDKFLRTLIEHMTAAIANEGTPGAVVPLLVRGDSDHLDKIRHVDLSIGSEKSVPEIALRDKCVERIALGLDMPPEVLLGVTDANHWTAWAISEDSFAAHIEPVAQEMVSDFTTSFFRPTLEALGVDSSKFRIWYDASAVVNHPDRGADATQGYELMLLSGDSWRAAHGFDSDDAPKVEELYRRIGTRFGDLGLVENGKPEESTGPLAVPGATPTDPTTGGGRDKDDGETPAGDAKPAETPPADGDPGAASLDRSVWACATLMGFRARQLAGSRLRTQLKKDKAGDAWSSTENVELCHHYATANPGALDPDRLVAGAGSEMLAILVKHLGIPRPIAEQVVAGAEQWAAATLLDADPGPIPDWLMARVEVASALIPTTE